MSSCGVAKRKIPTLRAGGQTPTLSLAEWLILTRPHSSLNLFIHKWVKLTSQSAVKNEWDNAGPTLSRINRKLLGLADEPLLYHLANSVFISIPLLIHQPPSYWFSISWMCQAHFENKRPLSLPELLSPGVHTTIPSLHLILYSNVPSSKDHFQHLS